MIDPAKPSLKERQWNLREDAILDAASELMATKGFNAMTMDDIANVVGISKATLYLHFSSKHDLVVSVACRATDRRYDQMQAIDEGASAKDRVAQLIDRIVVDQFEAGRPSFAEAFGELTETLPADHPFKEKEARNRSFILQMLKEAESQDATIPGLSIAVGTSLVLSLTNSSDLERMVANGDLSPGEIADSLKRMLLRAA